jgi:predicted GNAT family N-acyltransferase
MIKTKLHVKIVDNIDEMNICYKLREIVFIQELDIPHYDEKDNSSIHFLLLENNLPIGTVRIFPDNKIAVLGRLCLLKEQRKKGAGKILMEEVINYCKKQGFEKIVLGTQEQNIGFYGKSGFTVCEEKIYGRKYAVCDMQLILNKG